MCHLWMTDVYQQHRNITNIINPSHRISKPSEIHKAHALFAGLLLEEKSVTLTPEGSFNIQACQNCLHHLHASQCPPLTLANDM